MKETFYNLKDVSIMIKTPIPYLRKMIKTHKLNGHFIGRQYIISDKDLKDYIDSCKGAKNDR